LYSWRVSGWPGSRLGGVSDDQRRAVAEVSDALHAGAGTRGSVQTVSLSGRIEYLYGDVIARGMVHEPTGAVVWTTVSSPGTGVGDG
jgi:hypothetical protein